MKCLRESFTMLGSVWADIGKQGTDLNFLVSSPTLRHPEDTQIEIVEEDPSLIAKFEATDTTWLDFSKLLLLGTLYCKGSRIGKSNILYPLLTFEKHPLSPVQEQSVSSLKRRKDSYHQIEAPSPFIVDTEQPQACPL